MVEQALHGYDVQPSAVHFAATRRLKHGDVAVPEIDALAELLRQSPLPNAGNQDENDVGASCVVVLRCGFQPVVEGTPPQGQALADHAEAAAVVEGDGGVEAAPVRWNSTCERRDRMPGDSEAARRYIDPAGIELDERVVRNLLHPGQDTVITAAKLITLLVSPRLFMVPRNWTFYLKCGDGGLVK